MIDVIKVFWDGLSPDVRTYITGLAINLTTGLLTAKRAGNKGDIEEPLSIAYEEGLKYFTKTLDDNGIDYDKAALFKDKGLETMFIDIVANPGQTKDAGYIEDSLKNSGIDLRNSINISALNEAVESFLKGFMSKAELAKELEHVVGFHLMKKLINLHEQRPPDLALLKRKYFCYLKNKYSYMGFKGLSEGKTVSFPLKDVYTMLSFASDLPAATNDHLKKREQIGRLEVLDRVKESTVKLSNIMKSRYSVITGEPGSGKSTILKYITLAFVNEEEKERLGAVQDRIESNNDQDDERFLPILFPISAYAESYKKRNDLAYSLKDSISDYFRGEGLPDLLPLFNNAFQNGKAVVLFDGLDEVANESERKKMVSDISNFIGDDEHINNRFMITCRIASYTKTTRFERIKNNEFAHYTVLPFDIEGVKDFLLKWYLCYENEIYKRVGKDAKREAERKLEKMITVIKNNRNILDLATNPLMLTILALIEHEGGELPKNRADLYGRCLKMLSGAWENLHSLYETEKNDFRLRGRKITEDFVVDYFGPIAFEMHEKAQPHIEYDELKSRLAKKFNRKTNDELEAKEMADELIEIMKNISGILQEVATGIYGFMHLTFKEYLAARVLTDLSDDIIAQLGDNIFKPEWKEVVLLAVDSFKKVHAKGLTEAIYNKTDEDRRNVILAGHCVMDAGKEKFEEEDFYDLLKDDLLDVMNSGQPIDIRVESGEILGYLDDTRDLKEFIDINENFALAKYPVTNQWFGEFVKSGGYANKDYWTEEGLKWLEFTGVKQPRYGDDPRWKSPNSPVVGVSWYEALAFTKWLNVEMDNDYEYRLPDENEWECAVVGVKGWQYPWGDQWNKENCNNSELGINKTTPVGMFSKGDTVEGISDLSGNVWEWTNTNYHSKEILQDFTFDKDMQTEFDKGNFDIYFKKFEDKECKLPVLRGGSWYDGTVNCRCGARNRDDPGDRDYLVGFRCARTPKN